jgi:hypothetical protein
MFGREMDVAVEGRDPPVSVAYETLMKDLEMLDYVSLTTKPTSMFM